MFAKGRVKGSRQKRNGGGKRATTLVEGRQARKKRRRRRRGQRGHLPLNRSRLEPKWLPQSLSLSLSMSLPFLFFFNTTKEHARALVSPGLRGRSLRLGLHETVTTRLNHDTTNLYPFISTKIESVMFCPRRHCKWESWCPARTAAVLSFLSFARVRGGGGPLPPPSRRRICYGDVMGKTCE